MRQALKFWTEDGFPRDFWNYHINPITGFLTYEPPNIEKELKKKYYKETQSTEL